MSNKTKTFKLDEIGVMSGDILILKPVPNSTIILSNKVLQDVLVNDDSYFTVGKVGAGVNNTEWATQEGEQEFPKLLEGCVVFPDNILGLKAIKVENSQGQLFIGIFIQAHNIKFYLK